MDDQTKQIICTGRRAGDMALRLFYGDYQNDLSIEDDIDQAVSKALASSEHVYVIATYTALLVARKAITKEMGL